MIQTFISGGINWDWFLCGDFNEQEKTVHIYFHDRWHRYDDRGSKAPKVTGEGSFRINEDKRDDGKRIAHTLSISRRTGKDYENTTYLITNPAQVFSYSDMAYYAPEA